MAINYVDYKITDLQMTSQGIHITIRIYGGDITTENEANEQGALKPVTRYRRQQMIREISYTLDPTQVTNLVTRWLNKKLAQEAQSRGKQVISDQNSTNV